jgi:hydroxypyruvate isomerase
MKYDVCLDTVFPELPAAQRIERIARAGFRVVEFWFQSSESAAAIRQACDEHGVTINNLVVNSADGRIGGAPVNTADLNKYLERVEEAIAQAKSIDCHMGITCSGNVQLGITRTQMRAALENAYGQAAEIAAKHDFTLVAEPLNTHVDHAGYYLDSSDEGAEIVRAIGSPNLKLLFDVYHMQIMEGNLIAHIEKHIDIIGHFHSAGVPGRHEVFGSEINYPAVVKRIEELGYTGCFGLEYMPAMADHEQSLKQTLAYLSSGSADL